MYKLALLCTAVISIDAGLMVGLTITAGSTSTIVEAVLAAAIGLVAVVKPSRTSKA